VLTKVRLFAGDHDKDKNKRSDYIYTLCITRRAVIASKSKDDKFLAKNTPRIHRLNSGMNMYTILFRDKRPHGATCNPIDKEFNKYKTYCSCLTLNFLITRARTWNGSSYASRGVPCIFLRILSSYHSQSSFYAKALDVTNILNVTFTRAFASFVPGKRERDEERNCRSTTRACADDVADKEIAAKSRLGSPVPRNRRRCKRQGRGRGRQRRTMLEALQRDCEKSGSRARGLRKSGRRGIKMRGGGRGTCQFVGRSYASAARDVNTALLRRSPRRRLPGWFRRQPGKAR